MRRVFLMAAAALTACSGPSGSDAGMACPAGAYFCPYTDPGPTKVNNGLLVTVTGEGSATQGNPFPPSAGQEVVFQDGWQLDYTHVLVTVGKVAISESPDMSPSDQSQTGPLVAQLDGPFAVDLAKTGPLDSKELNGKSWRLGRLTRKKDGTDFSTTTKYAFGFDLVAAKPGVVNVNLDADAQTLYQTMADKGFTVLYQGTATWKGDLGTPACRSTVASYDWARVPKKVNFTIGWKVPVSFKNCVNPDLMPADTRGVQTQANDETVAQATFHLDHPFWDALEEDAPLRWDAIAARKSAATAPAPATVDITEADLAGVDFQAFKDAQGTPMAVRFCGEQAAAEPTTGTLRYDPKSVPVNAAGGATGLKDYYDYTTYNLSTFGHLNNDGLCYPARNYASP